MRAARSLILDVGVRYLFHTILVLSVYLLFAGHNAPGGGFAGGLVAGAALVLRDIAGGTARLSPRWRVAPETYIALGLLLAVATGIVAVVAGGELLESAELEIDVPLLRSLKTTSALLFDIGVYLIVVGVVSTILERLGGEPSHGSETGGE